MSRPDHLPAFSAFLEANQLEVYRVLRASVGPSDADDCFQEAFLAALRAYPTLRPGSNLRAWILTIAHRKAIDVHRRRARTAVPVAELPEAPAAEGGEPEPALWAAVRSLPDGQRAAIVHRYVADLPYAEVGRVLGCSEAAARQRVAAGLAKLKEAGLEEER